MAQEILERPKFKSNFPALHARLVMLGASLSKNNEPL